MVLPHLTFLFLKQYTLHSLGNLDLSKKRVVIWDGQNVKNFTVIDSTLQWKAEDGNSTNGQIQFQQSDPMTISIDGYVWDKGMIKHFNTYYFSLTTNTLKLVLIQCVYFAVCRLYRFEFSDEAKPSKPNMEANSTLTFKADLRVFKGQNITVLNGKGPGPVLLIKVYFQMLPAGTFLFIFETIRVMILLNSSYCFPIVDFRQKSSR